MVSLSLRFLKFQHFKNSALFSGVGSTYLYVLEQSKVDFVLASTRLEKSEKYPAPVAAAWGYMLTVGVAVVLKFYQSIHYAHLSSDSKAGHRHQPSAFLLPPSRTSGVAPGCSFLGSTFSRQSWVWSTGLVLNQGHPPYTYMDSCSVTCVSTE